MQCNLVIEMSFVRFRSVTTMGRLEQLFAKSVRITNIPPPMIADPKYNINVIFDLWQIQSETGCDI